ncbi:MULTISPECIES: metal ABC transporter permease [unclassified Rhodococcus (in: high G+C Gram-positive bacteria)]|uniref:metal ABC transporter permease n=1 Tax=unclassified Rhodococcus (in: high G+C Gram-positive bacteria) TaxID=192944 RepID=UPI00163A81E5|nr:MULTISPECIES: metal ABC transporter permease [unclassified Rhodococcus (in: high G+C Gram-positive bacteria)]MBC2641750.1 metal ABC transporter permease [Rhodococcus sp. 3A]MBC2893505.1 metal ABC transporter permease [Rhodococcus sp. 4CII]
MSNKFTDAMSHMFDVSATVDLLQYDFVQQALIAGAILGLLAGAIGPLIVSRQMSFAVHGTSELSLTGASAALLIGVSVGAGAITGSVVAAVLFGLLGAKARDRDSVIGVIMAFGLGLSVLFIWSYQGRTGTSFSLLIGQIVAPGNSGLQLLLLCAVLVIGVLGLIYRPLLFASTDPDVAEARGVPVRALSIVFAVLVGITAALGVQIVGALLVMALLITPAAAAAYVTASPLKATILSIVFAELAAVGGILLSLAPGVPVSSFVTSISFIIYLVCRLSGSSRRKNAGRIAHSHAAHSH